MLQRHALPRVKEFPYRLGRFVVENGAVLIRNDQRRVGAHSVVCGDVAQFVQLFRQVAVHRPHDVKFVAAAASAAAARGGEREEDEDEDRCETDAIFVCFQHN